MKSQVFETPAQFGTYFSVMRRSDGTYEVRMDWAVAEMTREQLKEMAKIIMGEVEPEKEERNAND